MRYGDVREQYPFLKRKDVCHSMAYLGDIRLNERTKPSRMKTSDIEPYCPLGKLPRVASFIDPRI